MSNRSFQELNLNNAFLFPAALEDPETCRLVIECIIGEVVGELKVKTEYTKLFNSELKSEGKNREEVPKILIDFLGYLNDSTDMYMEQDLDEKVKRIHERIKQEEDINILKSMHKTAMKAKSVGQFEEQIANL